MNWIHQYIRYNLDFSDVKIVVDEMQKHGYTFINAYYKRQWPLFWVKKYTIVFNAPESMKDSIIGKVKLIIN